MTMESVIENVNFIPIKMSKNMAQYRKIMENKMEN